jgi:hypothetical protein
VSRAARRSSCRPCSPRYFPNSLRYPLPSIQSSRWILLPEEAFDRDSLDRAPRRPRTGATPARKSVYKREVFTFVTNAAGTNPTVMPMELRRIYRCVATRIAAALLLDNKDVAAPRGHGSHACAGNAFGSGLWNRAKADELLAANAGDRVAAFEVAFKAVEVAYSGRPAAWA